MLLYVVILKVIIIFLFDAVNIFIFELILIFLFLNYAFCWQCSMLNFINFYHFRFRWEELRPKLEGNPAYEAVSEFERARIFKEYQKDLEEAW